MTVMPSTQRRMVREFYENRVTAGAEWLDREIPDWYQRINIAGLDMHSSRHCVLGQLFVSQPFTSLLHPGSPYTEGLDSLPDGVNGNDFGFDLFGRIIDGESEHDVDELLSALYNVSDEEQFEMLAECWIAQINERKENVDE